MSKLLKLFGGGALIALGLLAQNPNTASFPTPVTDATLFVATNLAQGTLNGAINNSVTTIPITAGNFVAPTIVTIESEIIHCTTFASNQLSGCTRGSEGTAAASHISGISVFGYNSAWYHNQVAAEIKAIEASVVTASSPGAGLCHFAGGTQACTSSLVSLTGDVTGVLPSANSQPHTISLTIDGAGSVIPTGQYLVGGELPSSCVIKWFTVQGKESSGSISIEVDAHSSSAPPSAPSVPNTTTDKISASAPITISAAQTASGGTSEVSTWTTSRAAYDAFAFNVVSVSTFTHVSIVVGCQ